MKVYHLLNVKLIIILKKKKKKRRKRCIPRCWFPFIFICNKTKRQEYSLFYSFRTNWMRFIWFSVIQTTTTTVCLQAVSVHFCCLIDDPYENISRVDIHNRPSFFFCLYFSFVQFDDFDPFLFRFCPLQIYD